MSINIKNAKIEPQNLNVNGQYILSVEVEVEESTYEKLKKFTHKVLQQFTHKVLKGE